MSEDMSKKTIRILIIILSTMLALLVLLGVMVCRSTGEPPPPPPEIIEETPEPTPEIIEVESITILLDSEEVVRGARLWPEVIIHPADATDKSYEIHSDNELILRPLGNQWIAAGVGTANLIATAENGIAGMLTVTVTAPDLESISFGDDEITMALGDLVTLIPTIYPRDARMDEPINFTSEDESVATVTADGRIVATGAGTTIIRGAVGEVSTEIRVTVIVAVRSITVIFNRRVYSVGDQAEFSIRVNPENATNANVTVSFSGASVTSTGENTFRCNEAGEVVITFTAENGVSASQTIAVYDLTALADEVHRLTNIERANLGLSQLGRSAPLTQTALVRAREIITLFSHTRPDGRDCFTAFDENNVQYQLAGENLAAGQRTPSEAVQSWMDSPGHRENIVNTDFGHLGVGVTMDNDGRLYWTQTFTD